MKHPILTILKKELTRFFGDKRMVISILLPGILIYVMYSFMGSALTSQFYGDEAAVSAISAVNLPDSVRAMAEPAGIAFDEIDASEIEARQDAIAAQADFPDALAIFPADFDEAVVAYEIASGDPAPAVEIYYNSVSGSSESAYQTLYALLDGYEAGLINKFDVNRGEGYDLASEQDLTGMMFSSLLPMLLMIFLFSGCLSVAPESIAGEKERGTIATLLVTPVKRSSIALGKILALSIIALLSGASSAVGTILALPKLMGPAGALSGDVYGPGDYLALAVVILSTVLVLVTLISLISAFAKSIKEASTLAMPLMILVMVLSITAMFGTVKTGLGYFCIPLYNSVQCMSAIFSFQLSAAALWVTTAANLVVTGLGVFLLTRMFHSEKVIFSR